MSKIKHNWNTWENYLRVHENVLKRYHANFPNQAPRYTLEKVTDHYFVLKIGKLELVTSKGTIVQINIEKDVEVQPGARKPIARTVGYSYQAWIKGGNNLIRYCSPHETHNQFHHKHEFIHTPAKLIQVGKDAWPHVSEFLDEVINSF